MAIKAKSFEGSAARKKRYEREVRDLQREIERIDRSIKSFQEQIDEQPESYRKLEEFWTRKIEKATNQEDKAEYRFQRDKDLQNHAPETADLARRAIAQFEEKKRPLLKRMQDCQRWLDAKSK